MALTTATLEFWSEAEVCERAVAVEVDNELCDLAAVDVKDARCCRVRLSNRKAARLTASAVVAERQHTFVI